MATTASWRLSKNAESVAQQELHQEAPAELPGQAAAHRGGEAVAGFGVRAAEVHADDHPVAEALPVAGHQDQQLRVILHVLYCVVAHRRQ